jgi:hypothetical protein
VLLQVRESQHLLPGVFNLCVSGFGSSLDIDVSQTIEMRESTVKGGIVEFRNPLIIAEVVVHAGKECVVLECITFVRMI